MLLIAVVSLDTVSLMDAGLRNVKLGIAPVLLDNSFSKIYEEPRSGLYKDNSKLKTGTHCPSSGSSQLVLEKKSLSLHTVLQTWKGVRIRDTASPRHVISVEKAVSSSSFSISSHCRNAFFQSQNKHCVGMKWNSFQRAASHDVLQKCTGVFTALIFLLFYFLYALRSQPFSVEPLSRTWVFKNCCA